VVGRTPLQLADKKRAKNIPFLLEFGWFDDLSFAHNMLDHNNLYDPK